jgi:CTP:molybdopterin cytidylyltransferase MocA
MHSIDAIILSAGKASRFGVPKVLLPAGPGEVLLTRVLAQALQTADGQLVVVLGREAGVVQYAIERWLERHPGVKESVYLVVNPHHAQGQSTSIKLGLRALRKAPGALVFLADMPAQEPGRLAQLRDAILSRGPQTVAVAAGEQGQIRPPVFLAKKLFPAVARLAGDQGARAVLQEYKERVELVEWGSGPWFCDVDDWSTYQELALTLGWACEPFVPLPLETCSATATKALVDAALASEIVPWLSPGLLLLAAEGETHWLKLRQTYRGVRGIIQGPARTPAAYLELLRRASLAVLAAETSPKL